MILVAKVLLSSRQKKLALGSPSSSEMDGGVIKSVCATDMGKRIREYTKEANVTITTDNTNSYYKKIPVDRRLGRV